MDENKKMEEEYADDDMESDDGDVDPSMPCCITRRQYALQEARIHQLHQQYAQLEKHRQKKCYKKIDGLMMLIMKMISEGRSLQDICEKAGVRFLDVALPTPIMKELMLSKHTHELRSSIKNLEHLISPTAEVLGLILPLSSSATDEENDQPFLEILKLVQENEGCKKLNTLQIELHGKCGGLMYLHPLAEFLNQLLGLLQDLKIVRIRLPQPCVSNQTLYIIAKRHKTLKELEVWNGANITVEGMEAIRTSCLQLVTLRLPNLRCLHGHLALYIHSLPKLEVIVLPARTTSYGLVDLVNQAQEQVVDQVQEEPVVDQEQVIDQVQEEPVVDQAMEQSSSVVDQAQEEPVMNQAMEQRSYILDRKFQVENLLISDDINAKINYLRLQLTKLKMQIDAWSLQSQKEFFETHHSITKIEVHFDNVHFIMDLSVLGNECLNLKNLRLTGKFICEEKPKTESFQKLKTLTLLPHEVLTENLPEALYTQLMSGPALKYVEMDKMAVPESVIIELTETAKRRGNVFSSLESLRCARLKEPGWGTDTVVKLVATAPRLAKLGLSMGGSNTGLVDYDVLKFYLSRYMSLDQYIAH